MGAPFSPSTGSLRFNLSPASFTHLLGIHFDPLLSIWMNESAAN